MNFQADLIQFLEFLPKFCNKGKCISRNELEIVVTKIQLNKVRQTSECKLLYPVYVAVGKSNFLQIHEMILHEDIIGKNSELVSCEVEHLRS